MIGAGALAHFRAGLAATPALGADDELRSVGKPQVIAGIGAEIDDVLHLASKALRLSGPWSRPGVLGTHHYRDLARLELSSVRGEVAVIMAPDGRRTLGTAAWSTRHDLRRGESSFRR
jgi:hypothetical protein